jgi:hypothetical protein
LVSGKILIQNFYLKSEAFTGFFSSGADSILWGAEIVSPIYTREGAE